jgi:hypothetical protein
MKMDILEEAVRDAKKLREAAIENAKNVLVEALSPKIREMVDGQLGETEEFAEVAMDAEEGEDLPVEMYEAADEDEEEEVCEAKDDEEDDEMVDENSVVQITSEDVRKAVAEFLKTEASVSKAFGDAEDVNAGATGLADEKSGEHQWVDETPPAKEDWTVKEAKYKKLVMALQKENAKLKGDTKSLFEACTYLKGSLQEVNIFNSKLLYTNKILQCGANLSSKQKISVIEAFDKAKSLREVELVYESLSRSFEIAGVLGEAKKVSAKTNRSSRMIASSGTSRLLEEQRTKETGSEENSFFTRMKTLAGLVE